MTRESLTSAGLESVELIPLTRAQHLLWVGERLNPAASLYNMALTFDLRVPLNVARFRQAFDRLSGKENMLRAAMVHGQPALYIKPTDESPTTQLRDVAYADLGAVVDRLVAQPFERDGVLTRSLLLRHDDCHFSWLLIQHHLVGDVASFFILHDRMAAEYESLGSEEPSTPAWPRFEDYAVRERQIGEKPKIAAARTRILNATEDYVPAVSFYPRNAGIPSWRNHRRVERLTSDPVPSWLLSNPLSADLDRLLWFLVVFAVTLHRLGGNARPVIGIPVHNRSTPKRRDTVGMLMEVVPVSVGIDADSTASGLFGLLQRAIKDLMSHGSVGLSDAEAARRFDVVLNYVVVPDLSFGGSPVSVLWNHCGAADPAHAVRLHVWRDGARTDLIFDFREDTFDRSRQTDFVNMFKRVMEQANREPGRPVRDYQLLTAARIRAITDRAVGSLTTAPEGSLIERIQAQCARTPDATALIQGGRRMSYAELDIETDRIAEGFRIAGLGSGHAVVVLLSRSLETVTCILGSMKVGAAFVPLDPATPQDRLKEIFSDLGGGVPVVARAEDAPGFHALGCEVLDLEQPPVPVETRTVVVPDGTCYVLFTSGSTGKPKGVVVACDAINDYIAWAQREYQCGPQERFGLFTPLSFDLTLTSLLLPLVCGASLRVYPESRHALDMSLTEVIAENELTVVKLTPSHLGFWKSEDLAASRIHTWIVGGEDFKSELARRILRHHPHGRIYNEYGPTEATVACMLHRFDPTIDKSGSVPIGLPADNHTIQVLDRYGHPVEDEVAGEVYIGGTGLATGYLNRSDETAARFILSPFDGSRVYKSGDLGRWNRQGRLEYLGRSDRQVKLSGIRLELEEIDNLLLRYPGVSQVVTDIVDLNSERRESTACVRCGITECYPGIRFDQDNVCSICTRFDRVRPQVMRWFRSEEDFANLARQMKQRAQSRYHCAALFSGGKDSTYMVYRLKQFGLHVLALTLDNGFLSKQAHDNIQRAVKDLDMGHVYLKTEHMNRIFSASLSDFNNVCNGCFKTIYTLSMKYALEHDIGHVVTGLSRGQLFETRLNDLFDRDDVPVERYDEVILRARKAYHRMDDTLARSLDSAGFVDDASFERVRFVDFYRYFDVPLEKVYDFLENEAPWTRPHDTGRSTNCLINDTGIYVHKNRTGFHNYALPYSWDVRLGHKTRQQAMDELNDEIDAAQVARNLAEIGYDRPVSAGRTLVSLVAGEGLDAQSIKDWLSERLPRQIIPQEVRTLDRIPLNANGKVDFNKVLRLQSDEANVGGEPPRGEMEQQLAKCWEQVLGHSSTYHRSSHFFSMGGDSMSVILLLDELLQNGLQLDAQAVFDCPVLADMSTRIRPMSYDGVVADHAGNDEDFDLALSPEEARLLSDRFRRPVP